MGSPWEVVAPIVPIGIVAVVVRLPVDEFGIAAVDVDGGIVLVGFSIVAILVPIGDELVGVNVSGEVVEVVRFVHAIIIGEGLDAVKPIVSECG